MVAQAIKNQIEKIEYRKKKIFWILLSIFIFFILCYLILLNRTIINTVSKQQMENEIISLNSQVNSADFQYLNLKNSITPELAMSKGFISISETNFAYIQADKMALSLSLNKN